MNTKLLVLILVLAIAGAALVAPLVLNRGAPEHEPTPPPAQAPEPPQAVESITVNRLEYERILNGMGYWEVVDLIGGLETEAATDYDEGTPGYTGPTVTVWRTWKNPDGSWAKVAFDSDKVVDKRAEGLN